MPGTADPRHCDSVGPPAALRTFSALCGTSEHVALASPPGNAAASTGKALIPTAFRSAAELARTLNGANAETKKA
jgi:hypothetical protein